MNKTAIWLFILVLVLLAVKFNQDLVPKKIVYQDRLIVPKECMFVKECKLEGKKLNCIQFDGRKVGECIKDIHQTLTKGE